MQNKQIAVNRLVFVTRFFVFFFYIFLAWGSLEIHFTQWKRYKVKKQVAASYCYLSFYTLEMKSPRK